MSCPDLSLQDVLDLQAGCFSPDLKSLSNQAELFDGFSDPQFREAGCRWADEDREALDELEAIHGKAYRNYTDDHTKLFLTVQNKVKGASEVNTLAGIAKLWL